MSKPDTSEEEDSLLMSMCGMALPYLCGVTKCSEDLMHQGREPSIHPAQWTKDIILKQGTCRKRAASTILFMSWKERHIVLRPSRITWHMESGYASLGELLLGATSKIAVDSSRPYTFVVSSYSKTVILQTASDLDLQKWILAISDVIQGWQAPQDPYYPVCTVPTIGTEYHIGKRIGWGGFGEVFEAKRTSDSKIFAVKAINLSKMLENGLSLNDIEYIKWEVKILIGIDHPSIAKMEAYYREGNSIFIVFEMCKGGDLHDRIRKCGAYSEAKAKIVARRVLQAIAFCHSRNILHRDIKLENIVLSSKTDDTDVKLIDFGLARPPENKRFNMTCAGTRCNFAPEMIDKSQKGYYDKICPEKVDVWQLGIIVYAILSANHPFRCKENPLKETQRILDGHIKMSNHRWTNISEEAKAFVQCAMTMDAIERPSAEDLLQHPWLE